MTTRPTLPGRFEAPTTAIERGANKKLRLCVLTARLCPKRGRAAPRAVYW